MTNNTYLVYVVAALRDEGVVVGEEVGPLQHAVQLQLRLVPGLRGDGDWKKIRRNHQLGMMVTHQNVNFVLKQIIENRSFLSLVLTFQQPGKPQYFATLQSAPARASRVNCIGEKPSEHFFRLSVVVGRLVSQVEHVRGEINDLPPSLPLPDEEREREGQKNSHLLVGHSSLDGGGGVGGGRVDFFARLSRRILQSERVGNSSLRVRVQYVLAHIAKSILPYCGDITQPST